MRLATLALAVLVTACGNDDTTIPAPQNQAANGPVAGFVLEPNAPEVVCYPRDTFDAGYSVEIRRTLVEGHLYEYSAAIQEIGFSGGRPLTKVEVQAGWQGRNLIFLQSSECKVRDFRLQLNPNYKIREEFGGVLHFVVFGRKIAPHFQNLECQHVAPRPRLRRRPRYQPPPPCFVETRRGFIDPYCESGY